MNNQFTKGNHTERNHGDVFRPKAVKAAKLELLYQRRYAAVSLHPSFFGSGHLTQHMMTHVTEYDIEQPEVILFPWQTDHVNHGIEHAHIGDFSPCFCLPRLLMC